MLFHSKLRTLIWLKASIGEPLGDLDGWWDNLRFLAKRNKVVGSISSSWLKFSVASLVAAEYSVCRGVLIPNGGNFRAIFSGPMPPSNPALVVLLAVRVALETFLDVGFADDFCLEVEVNSFLVLNWLNNPLQRPWNWWELFAEIVSIVFKLQEIRFLFVHDYGNSTSLWLAKEGIRRQNFV
ncbi:hypothetical protein GQ457_17G015210 [Hibiscus cannabinus]